MIPRFIFQTWSTKNLPPLMFKAIQNLISENPDFKYFLFDDSDCREFIKNNFDEDILYAYDNLIPGAYKADLWRYCILFIKGGIYLDIKYTPINGFRFSYILPKEHLVSDVDGKGIYNALMICEPGNKLLFQAIRQIVDNVKTKFYGKCGLCPTGPNLLCNFISTNNEIVDLQHYNIGDKLIIISHNNKPILRCYNGYHRERENYSKTQHYSILWRNKNIYK